MSEKGQPRTMEKLSEDVLDDLVHAARGAAAIAHMAARTASEQHEWVADALDLAVDALTEALHESERVIAG